MNAIEEIQEECKKRFPIGCVYKVIGSQEVHTLIQDKYTYRIKEGHIYASEGKGVLYHSDGTYSELISLPKGYKVIKPKKYSYKYLIKFLNKYKIK
jgi:hypothetical protein